MQLVHVERLRARHPSRDRLLADPQVGGQLRLRLALTAKVAADFCGYPLGGCRNHKRESTRSAGEVKERLDGVSLDVDNYVHE